MARKTTKTNMGKKPAMTGKELAKTKANAKGVAGMTKAKGKPAMTGKALAKTKANAKGVAGMTKAKGRK